MTLITNHRHTVFGCACKGRLLPTDTLDVQSTEIHKYVTFKTILTLLLKPLSHRQLQIYCS